MSDHRLLLAEMLSRDSRYPIEAYAFIRDALRFAGDVLDMGDEVPSAEESSGEFAGTGFLDEADDESDPFTDAEYFSDEDADQFCSADAGCFDEDLEEPLDDELTDPLLDDELEFAEDWEELEAYEDELSACHPPSPTNSMRGAERHLTGQDLCEAIRQFALNQFGFMTLAVFNQWGITQTTDFGNIVYNMIDAGLMRKSAHDKRTDFDGVYDFLTEFDTNFVFSCRPLPNRA